MTALRVGLCGVVVFAVAAHGAVEVWSESVLWIAAALLLAWWALNLARQEAPAIRWNPLLVPVAALVLLAAVQWLAGLSVYPYLTRMATLRGLALLVLLFLFVQAFRTKEQVSGLAWFLMSLAFVAAVQGIIHHHTDNGKLYWWREVSSGGVLFGPYVNRNHFAGLMELLAPLGLAMVLLGGVRRERLALAGLLAMVPVGALFLSASRGGIASFLGQVILLLAVVQLYRRSQRRGSGPGFMAAATAMLLVAGAFLVWLDVGRAMERFSGLGAQDLARSRRVSMVQDSWRIFRDHPVTGSGFGTLVAVFPRYESLYDGKVVEHAHNDYVQTLAEGGAVGGALAVAFLLIWLPGALKRLTEETSASGAALRAGAVTGCSGLLFHGLVDFNLQIPSHTLLFLVLAAMSLADFSGARGRPRVVPPPGVGIA